MDIEHLHRDWDCTKRYRRGRQAGSQPVVRDLEKISDLFALLEQVLATQGTSLDEHLLTLGPKPGYLK